MDIQFTPTNNINLIQRNIKISKKIKIKLKRFLNRQEINKDFLKFKRTCN